LRVFLQIAFLNGAIRRFNMRITSITSITFSSILFPIIPGKKKKIQRPSENPFPTLIRRVGRGNLPDLAKRKIDKGGKENHEQDERIIHGP